MTKQSKKWKIGLYFAVLVPAAVFSWALGPAMNGVGKMALLLPCSDDALFFLMQLRRFAVLPLFCFLAGLGITGAVRTACPGVKIPWVFSRICLFACILLSLPGLWWGTAGFTFRYLPSASFRWYLMTHRYLWNLWWMANGVLAALVRRN